MISKNPSGNRKQNGPSLGPASARPRWEERFVRSPPGTKEKMGLVGPAEGFRREGEGRGRGQPLSHRS